MRQISRLRPGFAGAAARGFLVLPLVSGLVLQLRPRAVRRFLLRYGVLADSRHLGDCELFD